MYCYSFKRFFVTILYTIVPNLNIIFVCIWLCILKEKQSWWTNIFVSRVCVCKTLMKRLVFVENFFFFCWELLHEHTFYVILWALTFSMVKNKAKLFKNYFESFLHWDNFQHISSAFSDITMFFTTISEQVLKTFFLTLFQETYCFLD